MTQFWGKLFGINFALGVATGLTMEFEFGTNWSMNYLLQRSRNIPTGHVMVHIFLLCPYFVYITFTGYFY